MGVTVVRHKVNATVKNETSGKSRFGMQPSDEKLNKLQVDLLGSTRSNNVLENR